MTAKVGVISLGCPKNLVDTEIMLGLLSGAGYEITGDISEAQIAIINTCGFITQAKEEAIQSIFDTVRIKERGRLERVLVAGCLAQRYGGNLLAEIPEIDGVFGTGQVDRVVSLVERAMSGERLSEVGQPGFDYNRTMPRVLATPGHIAYVKIADGCSNRCSYCAIPGIRGGLRSRSPEVVEAEVRGLEAAGVKEVILVAQDTTAYGVDLYGKPRLAELLRRLAGTGIPWIRLMYCYPTGFTDELINVISREENICRYIDLPLQHINGEILKRMNRRGGPDEIKRLIYRLRSSIPGLTLRTTFIVGFPGEREDQFEELLDFVGEVRFERAGVFKFCPEEGTPAALMRDLVPDEVMERRYGALMSLQREISLANNLRLVNSTVRVIVDGKKSGRSNLYLGRTGGDAPEIDNTVLFSGGRKGLTAGEFADVRVTRAFDYGVRGVLVI
ncbi:MAG: 30S ribosomal protein S12 methylthiotransferase RimO [Bacillota bacterium]